MNRIQGGGWATLVAVLVLVAACSGGEPEPEVTLGTLPEGSPARTTSPGTDETTQPATSTSSTMVTSTTTPAPPTSTGDPAPQSGAESAWSGFWTAIPNLRPDGGLRGRATPEVKNAVSEHIYRPTAIGPLTRVDSHPVIQGEGDRRDVADCILTQPPLTGQPNQNGFLVTGTVENSPNGWRVTAVDMDKDNPACAPAALVEEARALWIRDLELELGLPESLSEMEALESEDLFSSTIEYADAIRDAGGSYQGERQLNPVVAGITFDDGDRVVVTLRSCHTYSDDFGVVANGEMLTDLYDPDVRRSDVGEVTLFEDGWRVSGVDGSNRPCQPGDGAIRIVGANGG